MGARAYLIREIKPKKFKAVYSHWGVDEIYRALNEGRFSYEFLVKLWEEALKKESLCDDPLIYELSIDDLYDFIRFDQIYIEAYVILWDSGEFTVFITLINSLVNGAVRFDSWFFDDPNALMVAFNECSQANFTVYFLRELGYSVDEIVDMLYKGWNRLLTANSKVFNPLVIGKSLREVVSLKKAVPLKTYR